MYFLPMELVYRFLVVFLTLFLSSACAQKHAISSPEGTTTSLVQKSGVHVFAPRSARAQKVTFSDKNSLISQPDTPLSNFFDEHRPDFANSQFQYAKNTIIANIYAQMENGAYLYEMIAETVHQYEKIIIKADYKTEDDGKKNIDEADLRRKANLLSRWLSLKIGELDYLNASRQEIRGKVESIVSGADNKGAAKEVSYSDLVYEEKDHVFVAALIQKLSERGFVKKIITNAIAGREDLFVSQGSRTQALDTARAKATQFFKDNIGDSYAQLFAQNKLSLWEMYIQSLNGGVGQGDNELPALINPIAKGEALQRFSSSLRSEIDKTLQKEKDLNKALAAAWQTKLSYLQSKKISSTLPISMLEDELANSPSLIAPHNALVRSLKDVVENLDIKNTAEIGKEQADEGRDSMARKSSDFVKGLKDPIGNISAAFEKSLSWHGAILPNENDEHYSQHKTVGESAISALILAKKLQSDNAETTDQLKNIIIDNLKYFTDSESKNFFSKQKSVWENLKASLDDFETSSVISVEQVTAQLINIHGSNEEDKKLFEIISNKGNEIYSAIDDLLNNEELTSLYETHKNSDGGIGKEYAAAYGKLKEHWIKKDENKKIVEKSKRYYESIITKLNENNSNFEVAKTNIEGLKELQGSIKLARTKNDELLRAVSKLEKKQNSYQESLESFNKAFLSRSSELIQRRPIAEQQQLNAAIAQIAKHYQAYLEQLRVIDSMQQSDAANLENLTKFISYAFDAELAGDASENKNKAIERFVALFKEHTDLLNTDLPALNALLASPHIGFSSEVLRKEGLVGIPLEFNRALQDKQPPSSTQIVDAIKLAFNMPKNAYLFGLGTANQRRINTFITEFTHRFSDMRKLSAALSAERNVDYDYWWLTFYPKAIPGEKHSLSGTSFIEVSFPTSVTPKEQYERWIHDQTSAFGTIKYERVDKKRLTAKYSILAQPKSKPVEQINWQGRLRIATSVVSDLLEVLDSSGLSERHSDLRRDLLMAQAEFTKKITAQQCSKSKISHTQSEFSRANYCNVYALRYYKGLQVLIEARGDEKVNSTKISTYCSTQSSTKIDRIMPAKKIMSGKYCDDTIPNDLNEVNFADYCNVCALRYSGCLNLLIQSPHTDETNKSVEMFSGKHIDRNESLAFQSMHKSYVSELKNQYQDFFSKLDSDKKPDTKEGIELYSEQRVNAVEKHKGTSISENFHSSQKARAEMIMRMQWEPFNLDHVILAVSSAAETGMALPFKIDLYLSAFFDGSRRFARYYNSDEQDIYHMFLDENYQSIERACELDDSREDCPQSNTKQYKSVICDYRAATLSKYLSPFDGVKKELDLIRFLALNGASLDDVLEEKAESKKRENKDSNTHSDTSLAKELRATPEDRDNEFKINTKVINNLSNLSDIKKRGDAARDLVRDLKRVDSELLKPSPYLEYPELWLFEMESKRMQDALRQIVSNLFMSGYPSVPTPDRIRQEFKKDDSHLKALIYEWLRDYWVDTLQSEIALYEQLGSRRGDRPENEQEQRQIEKNMLGSLLDRHPYLSHENRRYLLDEIPGNRNIHKWFRIILTKRSLVRELSENLLDYQYASLWKTIANLEQVERYDLPYKDLTRESYERFQHVKRPKVQPGITVVKMLPLSRDDLVSLSINEGGVMARMAAQANADAVYDTNTLKMLSNSFGGQDLPEVISDGSITEQEDKNSKLDEARRLLDKFHFKDSLSRNNYGASAAGQANLFGTARAAMAYSKRREYLDAAITAAGSGDNFAKWSVRKSDLRSNEAGTDSRRLVAAAHTGYPNGDQPFHLLVKIPHNAIQKDWQDKEYILFNSAYSATKRTSLWKEAGWLGGAIRIGAAAVNPRLWNSIEEEGVATVYPFKWDAKSQADQKGLLSQPNMLGGRVYLDATDEIPYDDIVTLINAEDAFIKTTRELQSADVKAVIDGISTQSNEFRKKVDDSLLSQRKGLLEQQKALEERMKVLEEKVKAGSKIPEQDATESN